MGNTFEPEDAFLIYWKCMMSDGSTKLKRYVAFLRGINVGGNTLLPMNELRGLCDQLGLKEVSTYIQSGNVIFESGLSETTVIHKLEQALLTKRKKRIPVMLRTIEDLQKILTRNPFPKADPRQVGVMFFAEPLPKDFSSGISTPGQEEVILSSREAYIHYPDGMGRSKLKLPKVSEEGTVRNINTISKIIGIAAE